LLLLVGGGRSRRSNCVKEVERLKQNRENRRYIILLLTKVVRNSRHLLAVINGIIPTFDLFAFG